MNDLNGHFAADDTSVGWGQSGLLLRLHAREAPQRVRDIPLDAPVGLRLLHDLKRTLAEHEARYGVSWSRHDTAFGATTDRRTGFARAGEALSVHGRALYRLLRHLPLNGFERSLKLQPGRILDERFLLGILRDQLDSEHIEEILDRLALPADWRAEFEAALPRTRFLHFGHEAAPEGSVWKLYQELGPAEGSASETSRLLFVGYKWDPAQPHRRAVSEYRLHPGLDLPSMRARIEALLPGRPDIARLGTALLEAATGRCAAQALAYLEVSERGNPRRSCDVNLYEADLKLAQVAPLLMQAAQALGIAANAMEAHLQRLGSALLGHVSAGTGRDGAPFLTVYYTLPDSAGD